MKKGIIVYITGEDDLHASEPRKVKELLDIEADRIEIVSNRPNGFDIHHATWRLIVAGMQHIVCLTAVYGDSEDLKLTGRELRLCG